MGDTYQSPAFGWLHAARTAGSAAITVDPVPLSSTPKERLIDGMLRRNMEWSAAGTKSLILDRGTGARTPVNRLYIPDGHTLAGYRIFVATSTTGAFAGEQVNVLPYALLRGSSVRVAVPTLRSGPNVFDYPAINTRYIRVLLTEGHPSTVPKFGELWWTFMRVPTAGLRSRWQRSALTRLEVRRLPSGTESILETGPASASWSIDTQAIDGGDRVIYEAMLRDTGYGRDALIFDPPEGGYETTIDACDTTAGSWSYSGSNGAPSNSATQRTEGTAAMTVDAGASPTQPLILTRTLSPDLNADGSYIGVDMRLPDISNLTATAGVVVKLADSSGVAIAETYGTNLFRFANVWYTVWFDTETSGNSGATVGIDFSALATIQITVTDAPAGLTYWYDHVRIAKKSRAPIVARIDSQSEETQANANPSGAGTSGSRNLELLEVVG